MTTEQTRPRALELTFGDVGSSLADVSDGSEYEFDEFVGANAESRSARDQPRACGGTKHASRAHPSNAVSIPTDHLRQSHQKHHRRPARAAAAIRHLSSRFSLEIKPRHPTSRKPISSYASLDSDINQEQYQTGSSDGRHAGHHGAKSSPSYRRDNWPVSALRLDSQEILGHGTHHDDDGAHHKSWDFAHHYSTLTNTSLPRFPFPLISLPEAAALQSQRRERGEEDHSDPGPAFAAKARSCTISTVSTNGPNTPGSPTVDSSWLTRPKQAYYRQQDRAQTLPYHAQGHHRSSDILDQDPHGSFFRTSVPNSTSLLSARFFRLSGFSARTRERRAQLRPVPSAQQRYFNDHSFFTPSQTDLIRSAREDILYRRRHRAEDDQPQRLIFIAILVLTIFFPLIGLLALCGKFDGTIAWYARGERACLTREQRGTLKQQLLVEAFLYPALIIALSVYYSVHK